MIGALAATFLTAMVEWVEAYTIVLAVALSIGWRRALGAALAAIAVLALLTGAGSLALTSIGLGNLAVLQFVIGVFLILFGLRWLAKAIARGAGLRPLHDEDEEFANLRARPEINQRGAAWAIAFQGVLLEGLEVWLIVVALGVQTHHAIAAAAAAIAALLVVLASGLALRKPLARVPEQTIKFTVGCGILAFGTFWTLQSLGYDWPLADASLLALFACNILGGLAITQFHKRRAA
jgi:uncharacterized membrane protein